MGCRSDYMEPRAAEAESNKVAKLIIYVEAKLGNHPAQWIFAAASNMYGAEAKVSELTAILCEAIGELTDEQMEAVVYNAHDGNARVLAEWWEQHMKDDIRHEREDAQAAADQLLLDRPEVMDLTSDGTGVIVYKDWYNRATEVMKFINGVNEYAAKD
jgi:hypothetical protein